MRKETILAAAATLLLVCSAQAQDNNKKRLEIGVQFSRLKEGNGVFIFGPTSVFPANPAQDRTALGVGGRIVYNLNRFWSLEAEANVFPEQNKFGSGNVVCCGIGTIIDGRIVEGLAGTKIGLRKRKLGIYGKVRPGFLRSSRTLGDCTLVSVGLQCTFNKGRTDFALDVGGTIELHISERWLIRSDLGDTMQMFSGVPEDLRRLLVPFLALDTGPQVFHNFQLSIGVGYRF